MTLIDLDSPLFHANPYPVYREIRGRGDAVYEESRDLWFVGGHETVVRLLSDKRLVKDRRYEQLTEEQDASALLRMKSLWILMRDGAFHRKGRTAVTEGMSHRSIGATVPLVREVCREIVKDVKAGEAFDLIGEVARPLPYRVISALLGVAQEQSEELRASSAALFRTLEPGMTEELWRAGEQAADHFTEVFGPHLRSAAAHGGPVIGAIVDALESGSMTEDEAIAMCSLMFIAGHETTTHFIGNAVNAIIERKIDIGELESSLAAEPRTLDELWRFDTSVQNTLRIAEQDIELADVTIPRGARCMVLLGSANRDERVFDRPDELEFDRPQRQHLGFGYGAHFCLGAPLARLEVGILLSMLASVGGAWSTAGDGAEWVRSMTVRGPSRFPMVIDGSHPRGAPKAGRP